MDESARNILQALYEESPVIRTYVEAIKAGNPVPYTLIANSDEMIRLQKIEQNARKRLDEINTVKQECRESEEDYLKEELEEILDIHITMTQEKLEDGREYEVIMLKDDAIVDGSRQVCSEMKRILELKKYAEFKGYEFSCTPIVKK